MKSAGIIRLIVLLIFYLLFCESISAQFLDEFTGHPLARAASMADGWEFLTGFQYRAT